MPDKLFRSVLPGELRELPKIDTSVAHIARVCDYWLGGKGTLVKWFRDARTTTGHRSYKHVTHTFRIRAQSLYGTVLYLIWVLCPIFKRLFLTLS